jgi:hypothetical protein
MDYARALSLAKRTGLGMSGALNGAIAAAFLGYAGISLFDAVGMAAALMIFGWTGGFTGVTVASSQLAGRERERLSSGGDPSEVLSSVGTLIAAWLFLSSAPPTVLGAAAIGFWWLFGVTLQIGAGVLARLRTVEPGIG